MRKTQVHIELVPVAVAKKILEREKRLAKRNGKGTLVVKKSASKASGLREKSKMQEVPAA